MTNPAATPQKTQATPDAAPGNWVERMPARAQPFLRLARADRPIGTWLLWIPCLWGLALAGVVEGGLGANAGALLWFAVLTGVGALAMRGAGCAYNDIVDKDFDGKVERTALRPLPSGQITVREAWIFLFALCLLGLAVLLQFNTFAILTGLASLGLVAAYPFMKRVTYWPQAWLGLTFNWGVLVGYAAIAGTLRGEAFAIYAAGLAWTLGYDTIYAHQDKEDDALIGVKSTALKFGAATRPWLVGFYAATLVAFTAAGALIGAGPFYYLALAPASLHFAWQIRSLDIDDAHNCLIRFKSNRDAGLLLLAAPICEGIARLI
ncbi:MAG: 4-hydroxybenzoate octaprenyltransferase [Pseudomonadota bacterium]